MMRVFRDEDILTSPLTGDWIRCDLCNGGPAYGYDHAVMCRACWAAWDEEMVATRTRVRQRRGLTGGSPARDYRDLAYRIVRQHAEYIVHNDDETVEFALAILERTFDEGAAAEAERSRALVARLLDALWDATSNDPAFGCRPSDNAIIAARDEAEAFVHAHEEN